MASGEGEAADAGKGGVLRRKFTADEDLQLRSLVERLGTKSWEEIARFLPGRSARQCRNRYKNYLLDSLTTNPWTPEEDAILIHKFHQIGPKWVEIGKLLSGRSGNNVKNRWYKHLCKADIGAPQTGAEPEAASPAPAEQRVPLNLSKAIGWSDSDWPKLFGSADNPMQFASSWSSGSSSGDPLF
jgi:hypothetical protein